MTSFGMKEVKAQPITEEEAPEYIEVPLERVEKQVGHGMGERINGSRDGRMGGWMN